MTPALKSKFRFWLPKCHQLVLTGVGERYWHICVFRYFLDFHKVPYSTESYATSALKAWSGLANVGFKQAWPHCSPFWCQITAVKCHWKGVTRDLLQKTTCRQFPYAVQSLTLAAHLPQRSDHPVGQQLPLGGMVVQTNCMQPETMWNRPWQGHFKRNSHWKIV